MSAALPGSFARDSSRTDHSHGAAAPSAPSPSPTPAPIASTLPFQALTVAPTPPLAATALDGQIPRSSLSIDTAASRPPPPQRTESLESNAALSRSRSLHGRDIQRQPSSSSLRPVSRTPSLKQALSKGISSSPGSSYPSPVISAMGSITPLPSPLFPGDSPGPWNRIRPRSSSRETPLPQVMHESVLVTASGESVHSAIAHQIKRKAYAGLQPDHADEVSCGKHEHARNRSISEYVSDSKNVPKRQLTVTRRTVPAEHDSTTPDHSIRREPHLSEARGITPVTKPPSPPPSESSQSNDGCGSKRPRVEVFDARSREDHKLRRWRFVKELGQGTFSRVVLATSRTDYVEANTSDGSASALPATPPHLDRKSLVAIKICEHGPRGGASENRVEMSLKRELEIMRIVDHPCVVHLKAWSIESTRALLVLSYSPGGDLFDIATAHRHVLTNTLMRRMFSELVGAVRYLHDRRIVHRDIKLENVLVNLTPQELADPQQDWITYPYSIITLTDLGLSRFVADDEKLETRCGSDDYAAPEVILGQPYDGRAIDAWSLGVLLYALMESRLPFDPHPNASDVQRMRSRTSHRIARVDWSWIKYAGDDGDHDADESKFAAEDLTDAMNITEGLLKRARSRWTLDKVSETAWVKDGIKAPGGIKFREEGEAEIISSDEVDVIP
ncbi:kinase-like domain-containing protein [Microdochium bolleyi]|uniref:Kinase-like domain-containing protein n=1 Tax=Microdochium bolleyi TaxID=196109 RepID=A0A136J6W1_9PEZI|nr:kinase-like domain-containing protein [Microdochium bolleyi]